ncbi:hypothetical protein BJV77DRAFT_968547 [Russula vinacea]|nr:hypothetical protein BJV77DRAFT_968547 [Russula vinacea]
MSASMLPFQVLQDWSLPQKMLCLLEDSGDIVIWIKSDHVLTWKMDLFWWGDIAAINILCDFITLMEFCRGPITTFVNVFEWIFDGTDRCNTLNIDVQVIFCRHVWIVWNNPTIVNHVSTDLVYMSIIRPKVFWVSILIHGSEFLKWLGKALHTLPIFHARCIRIECSARPMDHKTLHSVKKKWFSLGIRPIWSIRHSLSQK